MSKNRMVALLFLGAVGVITWATISSKGRAQREFVDEREQAFNNLTSQCGNRECVELARQEIYGWRHG
jgi:hypothetical protein